MSGFLNRLLGKTDTSAKNVARDRLRVVIMHDRAALPAPVLEQIRRDIFALLSKHMEIDEAQFDVSLERENDTVALVANVPIRRVRE